MANVIVEVRGGVVVEVYSEDPELRIAIFDWDDLAAGDIHGRVTERHCAPYAQMPREMREHAQGSDRQTG
jgi:hypothetical protein